MLSRYKILALVMVAGACVLLSTGCTTVRIPRIWEGEKSREACGNPILMSCKGLLVAASSHSVMCGVLFDLPEPGRSSQSSANSPGLRQVSASAGRKWAEREEAVARIASLQRPNQPVRTPLSRISLLPGRSLLLLVTAPGF